MQRCCHSTALWTFGKAPLEAACNPLLPTWWSTAQHTGCRLLAWLGTHPDAKQVRCLISCPALQNKALELGLTGWVRNRRDGRVEVTAEGYQEDLEAFLKWLHTGDLNKPTCCHAMLMEDSATFEQKASSTLP